MRLVNIHEKLGPDIIIIMIIIIIIIIVFIQSRDKNIS